LLEKVQKNEISPTPRPETLEAASTLVREQESAVSQLDAQRPAVVSMLQRGRDLGKDAHAPAFLHQQVTQLETGWSKAYSAALDKLNRIKSKLAKFN